ncbi:hypothetical protein L2E82_25174 [Cichorium intybus]|uniref:Uncharacterized protein n=1 Tax=Cichorium intybus TaxID=13427 RepID=A0ACB9E298_CICIN|nr:hypothetical protein L2E82_25174 [Cichorium intybus]
MTIIPQTTTNFPDEKHYAQTLGTKGEKGNRFRVLQIEVIGLMITYTHEDANTPNHHSIHQITPSINNIPPRFLNCINTAAESQHTAATQEEAEKTAATINCICKSFSNNLNWETLNRELKFMNVRNSAIINRVLIQLKELPNAKKALSFFHWPSHFANMTHQTNTYALLIHILVNAKLIKDASALIESMLRRSVVGNCKDPGGSENQSATSQLQNHASSYQPGTCNLKSNRSSSVLSFIHSLM